MTLVSAVGISLHRHPNVCLGIGMKTTGQDTHHGVRFTIELDGPAGDLAISSETRLPNTIAKYCNASAARQVLHIGECTTKGRRDAEQLEIVFGNVCGLHLLRSVTRAEIDAGCALV